MTRVQPIQFPCCPIRQTNRASSSVTDFQQAFCCSHHKNTHIKTKCISYEVKVFNAESFQMTAKAAAQFEYDLVTDEPHKSNLHV